MLTVVTNVEDAPAGPAGGASLIDEIVREGARRMLAAALEAEVAAYIAAHAGELDERGHRLVVRNGHAVPRQVLTSAGAVAVRAPRVNDKRVDDAHRFADRDLSSVDYVYLWADGVHLNVRLDEEKLCLLVMIGGTGRRYEGARRPGRWLPRVDRLVGRPAA